MRTNKTTIIHVDCRFLFITLLLGADWSNMTFWKLQTISTSNFFDRPVGPQMKLICDYHNDLDSFTQGYYSISSFKYCENSNPRVLPYGI